MSNDATPRAARSAPATRLATPSRLLLVAQYFPTGVVGINCYSDSPIICRCAEVLRVEDSPQHEIVAEELARLRLGPWWQSLWADKYLIGGLDITGTTPEQEAMRLHNLTLLRTIGDVGGRLRDSLKARAG